MDSPTPALTHATLYVEALGCSLFKVFEGLPDIGNSLYEYSTLSTYYTIMLTQSFLPLNRR